MAEADWKTLIDLLAPTVQVISVVTGVVISVLSFNSTRVKEAVASQLEAQKPFLQLRQNLYVEAVKQAAILTNPEIHTDEEKQAAKKRFRQLYVAELSMVEPEDVEDSMVKLAEFIDPELAKGFTPSQKAAYDLAHSLRDTFVESWQIDDPKKKSAAAAVNRPSSSS